MSSLDSPHHTFQSFNLNAASSICVPALSGNFKLQVIQKKYKTKLTDEASYILKRNTGGAKSKSGRGGVPRKTEIESSIVNRANTIGSEHRTPPPTPFPLSPTGSSGLLGRVPGLLWVFGRERWMAEGEIYFSTTKKVWGFIHHQQLEKTLFFWETTRNTSSKSPLYIERG